MSAENEQLQSQSCLFEDLLEREDNWNEQHFSDEGTLSSCSDAEPELQDSESDTFSADTDEEDDDTDQTVAGRTWTDIAPSAAHRLQSAPRDSGLTAKSENVTTMKECFHLFISDVIMDIIVKYTNQKAEIFHRKEQDKKWKPVDRVEIDAFFGLLLIMGRFRESRESTNSLWRANDAFSLPIYTAIMSRDRFREIFRFIRFDDLTTREERKNTDRLAPLRNVTNVFAANCRQSYEATNTGTIGGQLIDFRGRCPFKVHMPSKPGKYGMKLRTLCDAKTLYCCNLDVYSGKTRNLSEKNQTFHDRHRVVRQLTDFWQHSTRSVTANNFFTDISLAEELLQDEIFLVGALRKNSKDLPKSLINIRSRQQFSSEFLFTRDLTLVSYVSKPRKSVVLLSSLHHNHGVSGPEGNCKPTILSFYNSTKTAVDVFDKILREHSCRRYTRRWTLSLFLHYVDIAAYNAFVVWLLKNPSWESHTALKRKRKIFLEKLGNELYSANIDRRATAFENGEVALHKHVRHAIEKTGRKLIRKNEGPALSKKRSRCYMCIRNDNKYSAKCDECSQHICKPHTASVAITLCVNCADTE